MLVVQPAEPAAAASSPCRSAPTPAAGPAPSGCRSPRPSPCRARTRWRASSRSRLRCSSTTSRSSTPARLAALLEPVGDDRRSTCRPTSPTPSGAIVAEAGAATIDADAGRGDPDGARPRRAGGRAQYGAAAAVWSGVAAAVGDGLAADGRAADDRRGRRPSSGRRRPGRPPRSAGGSATASLRSTAPIAAADNPRGVDVAALDPVELTLVFGQIAPAAVPAPERRADVPRRQRRSATSSSPASGRTNTEVAYARDRRPAVRRRQRRVGDDDRATRRASASRIEVADQIARARHRERPTSCSARSTSRVGEQPDRRRRRRADARHRRYLDLLAAGASPPDDRAVPASAPTSAPPTSDGDHR